ncbi:MAG: M67 family metallopeptidase [Acidobacteriota bacterium]
MHRRRHGDRDGSGGVIAVRFKRGVLEAVATHAHDTLPAECCGLLIGSANDIVDAVRADNLSDDPNRYWLDPKAHIAARRGARERGLEVVGFYHSHPHSEPEPSSADLAEATYPGYLYLIVRPLTAGVKARLFRLEGGAFSEVAVSGDSGLGPGEEEDA